MKRFLIVLLCLFATLQGYSQEKKWDYETLEFPPCQSALKHNCLVMSLIAAGKSIRYERYKRHACNEAGVKGQDTAYAATVDVCRNKLRIVIWEDIDNGKKADTVFVAESLFIDKKYSDTSRASFAIYERGQRVSCGEATLYKTSMMKNMHGLSIDFHNASFTCVLRAFLPSISPWKGMPASSD